MKKRITIIMCLLGLVLSSCHNDIMKALDELDIRVTKLEELCKEMNTNISSLQTIINVQQSGDYITSVTPITKDGEVIGYTIAFAKHEPITIYNGSNGKDGKSAPAPQIGVKADSEGVYYWTIDGEWILDNNGQKLPVTGPKGGQGNQGPAGVTPQLKIEKGYWYVSYDNGNTWTELGRATGDKGDKGEKGDSMFTSVTYDDQTVTFTLTDGNEIVITRKSNYGNVKVIDGAIQAEFSVSATKKVYFSMGNLQYNAAAGTHACADGTTKKGTWRFALTQYDVRKTGNDSIGANSSAWIDLFGWGTSGYHASDSHNTRYYPYSYDTTFVNTTYNTYGYGPSTNKTDKNLTGTSANYDWGVYNAISNGGNQPGKWRTLTSDEWDYLLTKRLNADELYIRAFFDGNFQFIILPDNWYNHKGNFISFSYETGIKTGVGGNTFTIEQWKELESYGAVCIPYGSRRVYNKYANSLGGHYWSSTYYDQRTAYDFCFTHITGSGMNSKEHNINRGIGCSVRLVKDVQ